MIKVLLIFSVFVLTGIPHISLAQGGEVIVTLPNPLSSSSNIADLIKAITSALKQIGFPIAALVVIYAAFQMLLSGGDEKKFATGKKTLLYAVVGYAILLIADSIGTLVRDILTR